MIGCPIDVVRFEIPRELPKLVLSFGIKTVYLSKVLMAIYKELSGEEGNQKRYAGIRTTALADAAKNGIGITYTGQFILAQFTGVSSLFIGSLSSS
ncbi:hypothetical protein VCSRO91_0137 [Vibrio cholerae]|nr:hypothetical protein VCSRO57_0335 [Vibrio cholerae]GHX03704.1 hypothetical protein VCSRO156_0233 [Vibrio cholerae]GIB21974.1 hypothetical protein VCSRO91_0137 [Vibrio cholerae]